MNVRMAFVASMIPAFGLLDSANLYAQDVPGIEICTIEKTMERRTSCLQSNIDFLQKTVAKLNTDHQQKIEAANRQIESLKAVMAGLQKAVSDLQSAPKKPAGDTGKADMAPAKDTAKDAAPPLRK